MAAPRRVPAAAASCRPRGDSHARGWPSAHGLEGESPIMDQKVPLSSSATPFWAQVPRMHQKLVLGFKMWLP